MRKNKNKNPLSKSPKEEQDQEIVGVVDGFITEINLLQIHYTLFEN